MKNINPGTVSAMPALPMASGARMPLSQREKAAIVVQFLLTEGAELTLADLPEDLQKLHTKNKHLYTMAYAYK